MNEKEIVQRAGQFVDRLRKHIRSGPVKQETWSYDFLRHYLVNLRHGSRAVISEKDYPKEINLSLGWHSVLNLLRNQSQDGFERHVLIGLRNDQRLFIQEKPILGEKTFVGGKRIAANMERADRHHGINYVVGTIHSHPDKMHSYQRLLPFYGGFSPADYYALMVRKPTEFLMGVTQGFDNWLVFQTKESFFPQTLAGIHLIGQDNFQRLWYEPFGYFARKGANGEEWSPPENDFSLDLIKRLNTAICKKYSLVLYQAKKDKPFRRVE